MQIQTKTFRSAKPVQKAEDLLREFEGAVLEIVTFDEDGHTTIRQIDLHDLLEDDA